MIKYTKNSFKTLTGDKTAKKRYNMKEHALQNAIEDYLVLKNWLVIRINSGAVKTDNGFFRCYKVIAKNCNMTAGISDLIAMKNSKVLFIEVKTDKGKQTEFQKEFQKVCEKFNQTYLIIRNIDELIKLENDL